MQCQSYISYYASTLKDYFCFGVALPCNAYLYVHINTNTYRDLDIRIIHLKLAEPSKDAFLCLCIYPSVRLSVCPSICLSCILLIESSGLGHRRGWLRFRVSAAAYTHTTAVYGSTIGCNMTKICRIRYIEETSAFQCHACLHRLRDHNHLIIDIDINGKYTVVLLMSFIHTADMYA